MAFVVVAIVNALYCHPYCGFKERCVQISLPSHTLSADNHPLSWPPAAMCHVSVGRDRQPQYQCYVPGLPFCVAPHSRTSLEEVYRRHQNEADTVIDDLVTCKSTISRCSLEQHPLTSIFQFYQDIRGYVTDLRDCLNEKVGSNATLQYYSMESLGGWLGRDAIGKGKLWVNLKHC